MDTIELTIWQSLKVYWSFMWRAWIVSVPPVFGIMIVVAFFVGFPKSGETPQVPDLSIMVWFPLIWLVSAAAMIVLQAVAMRWTLKTKWSDFRLVVVAPQATSTSQSDLSQGPRPL